MASIGEITDLKINGESEYTGPGPVVLTWTPPTVSGSWASGYPLGTVQIDDGESWGEGGHPNLANWYDLSFTLTQGHMNHVKDSSQGYADIAILIWGTDENDNFIIRESNTVRYTYAAQEPSKTIGYYDGSSFVSCKIFTWIGGAWVECIPHCRDNGAWVECDM